MLCWLLQGTWHGVHANSSRCNCQPRRMLWLRSPLPVQSLLQSTFAGVVESAAADGAPPISLLGESTSAGLSLTHYEQIPKIWVLCCSNTQQPSILLRVHMVRQSCVLFSSAQLSTACVTPIIPKPCAWGSNSVQKRMPATTLCTIPFEALCGVYISLSCFLCICARALVIWLSLTSFSKS